MTRLTRKTTDEDYGEYSDVYVKLLNNPSKTKEEYFKDYPYLWEDTKWATDEALYKLGQLEDIEEELGCPLDVVFKALMNGFYICNGKDYIHIKECLGYHTKLKKWYWLNTSCEISDYGISWWTKKPKEEDNDRQGKRDVK